VRRLRRLARVRRRALCCDTSRRSQDERRHRNDEPSAGFAGLARQRSRASAEVPQRTRESARHCRLDRCKLTAHELAEPRAACTSLRLKQGQVKFGERDGKRVLYVPIPLTVRPTLRSGFLSGRPPASRPDRHWIEGEKVPKLSS